MDEQIERVARAIAKAVGDMIVWPDGVNDELTLRELLADSHVAKDNLLARASKIAAIAALSQPTAKAPVGEVTAGQVDREAMIAYENLSSVPLSPRFAEAIRAGQHDDMGRVQAFARHRIQAVEAMREERETGQPCPNCLKPVEVGQIVLPWDDAGEMHADCANPFSFNFERFDGNPEACVLIGNPMRQVPVSDIGQAATLRARVEALEGALRKIASCESHAPGDVVSIARVALSESPKP